MSNETFTMTPEVAIDHPFQTLSKVISAGNVTPHAERFFASSTRPILLSLGEENTLDTSEGPALFMLGYSADRMSNGFGLKTGNNLDKVYTSPQELQELFGRLFGDKAMEKAMEIEEGILSAYTEQGIAIQDTQIDTGKFLQLIDGRIAYTNSMLSFNDKMQLAQALEKYAPKAIQSSLLLDITKQDEAFDISLHNPPKESDEVEILVNGRKERSHFTWVPDVDKYIGEPKIEKGADIFDEIKARDDIKAVLVMARSLLKEGQVTIQEARISEMTDANHEKQQFYELTVNGNVFVLPIHAPSLSPEKIAQLMHCPDLDNFVGVMPATELEEKGFIDPQGKGVMLPLAGRVRGLLRHTTLGFTLGSKYADGFPPRTWMQPVPYHYVGREMTQVETERAEEVIEALGDAFKNEFDQSIQEKLTNEIDRLGKSKFESDHQRAKELQENREEYGQLARDMAVFVHYRPGNTAIGDTLWFIAGMGHVNMGMHTEMRGGKIVLSPIGGTATKEAAEEMRVIRADGREEPLYPRGEIHKLTGVVSSGNPLNEKDVTPTHLGVVIAELLALGDSAVLNAAEGEGEIGGMLPLALAQAWVKGNFEGNDAIWEKFVVFLEKQFHVTGEKLKDLPRTIERPLMSILDENLMVPTLLQLAMAREKGQRIPGALKKPPQAIEVQA